MQLQEFLARALQPEIYQRKGQRFMNMLRVHRPDIEQRLYLEEINPFYDDSKLYAAIQWVKDNWGEEDR